jgi:ribosomal protein L35
MKTNKSFTKRLSVSKNGKIKGRRPGKNHFNAKERTNTSMSKRRTARVFMDNKSMSRFLANI